MSVEENLIGKIFFKKYTIIKKLGQGSFGSIYEAECEDKKFAIKFENKLKGQKLLQNEAYIMNYLKGRKKNYYFIKNL